MSEDQLELKEDRLDSLKEDVDWRIVGTSSVALNNLPDATLSISKTIESIANEKAKKLNGKIKKV